jgi:uncharacterized protein involved in outer membrane biogenesis
MKRRVFVVVLVLPLLLLLGAVVYLKFADLSGYRSTVESAVTEALGRRLTIAGMFEPQVSLSTTVVAEDVTLANPAWSDDPAMIHADRVSITVNLWSLLFGPLRIEDLRIDGARVTLEIDAEGRANWEFELGGDEAAPRDPESEPPLILENATLSDITLVYREPLLERKIELFVQRLEAQTADDDMYDLGVDGKLNASPLRLSGRFGPAGRLLAGHLLRLELDGALGDVELSLDGSIADLVSLDGPNLNAEVHGPDSLQVTEPFGLPSLGIGAFDLSAGATASDSGIDVGLVAKLGKLSVEARGNVSTLLDPQRIDLTLSGYGPDLAAAGELVGVDDLPGGAFEVSGRLQKDASRVSFERVEARVGDTTLSLDGVLGTPPRMVATDLTFEGHGTDLSVFDELAGRSLPAASFRVQGHLVRKDNAVALEDFEATVGEVALRADGLIGDAPDYTATDLELHIQGPDLSVFSEPAQIELPAESFSIAGRVESGDSGIVVRSVEAHVGENTIRGSGTIGTSARAVGTDLTLRLTGPDAAAVGPFIRLPEFPGGPFDVSGRVQLLSEGIGLKSIEGHIGEIDVTLDGLVGQPPKCFGTDLSGRVSGPVLAQVTTIFGFPELPAERFDVEGGFGLLEDRYELKVLGASIGALELKLDGWIGNNADLDGTNLEIDVRGPDLAWFAERVGLPELPAERFAVSGHLAIDGSQYRLERVAGEFGSDRVGGEGTVLAETGLIGTDVEIQVAGTNLAEVGRFAPSAGIDGWPELPSERYSAKGRVRIDDSGYVLRDVEAAVGSDSLHLDGRLGAGPEFYGTDVTLEANGSDGSLVAVPFDLNLPAEPFRVRGRVRWLESGIQFRDLRVDLGGHRADVEGTLGKWPKLVGTNLDVELSGPDPSLITQLADLDELPAQPFEISGHFDGTPTDLSMKNFEASFGQSDLAGSFRVDLTDKPDIRGRFISEHLDVSPWLAGLNEEPAPESLATSTDKTAASKADRGGPLIPDTPLELDWLSDVDADVRLTAKKVITAGRPIENLEIGVRLRDGSLAVETLRVDGAYGGEISGTFSLEPSDDAYRVVADLTANDVRLGLLSSDQDPSDWAPLDIELQLDGVGRSAHEIAASANGRLAWINHGGRVKNSVFGLLTADVLVALLNILNPFQKEEPYTDYECLVLLVEIKDGVALLDPLASRSDKMTIVGRGRVNLENENLNLVWASKPRKGVGLSASAITNSYIKLGGTLSKPALEVKPLDAVATTGVAVATMGLSILAKGFWDRVTAEKKVCTQALKQIEKQSAP